MCEEEREKEREGKPLRYRRGMGKVRQAEIAGRIIVPSSIATDLEHAMLTALGRSERLSDEACRALPAAEMRLAQDAVERTVVEKIETYLLSAGRA